MKYCYLLTLGSKETICISPFIDPVKVSSWEEEDPLQVFSASTVTQEQKDELHRTIYKEIDRGVDRWVQDTRYLPRLFLGGFVFLVAYFILSLAVRDPIPMIDELVIASIATLAAVHIMSRRDRKSSLALKQRLTLKNQAGACTFALDDELKTLEHHLYELSLSDPIDLAESIATGEISFPCDLQGKNLLHFKEQFLTWVSFKRKNMLSLVKQLEKIEGDSIRQETFSSRLLKLSMNGTLDLPLFALTVELSK